VCAIWIFSGDRLGQLDDASHDQPDLADLGGTITYG